MKYFYISTIFFLSISCQSQTFFSNKFSEKITARPLNTMNCDELKTYASKSGFSLKNLAALRASQRCKDFNFNISSLSETESKIYASELGVLNSAQIAKIQDKLTEASGAKKTSAGAFSATDKFKQLKQLRAQYKKSNQKQKFLKSTDNLYNWALGHFKKSKQKEESFVILNEAAQIAAKSYWNENQSSKAEKYLIQTLKLTHQKFSGPDLHYLLGRIYEEQGKTFSAVEQYNLAIADIQKFPNFSQNTTLTEEKILWAQGWAYYKEKKHTESSELFKKLSERNIELHEKSKVQFYQARSLKHLGKTTASTQLLEAIAQNDFFGYYGLLAYKELGKKLPSLKKLKQLSKTAEDSFNLNLKFLSNTERTLYTDLIEYGEFQLAEKAIALLPKNPVHETNMSLYLAHKTELYLPLFRSFGKLNNDEKRDVFLVFPNLIFPEPYSDHVQKMASETKLPKSLIYSIMKQESAFNEKARSPADAMGLMQVIPRLAKHLSKKFEVPYRAPEDLYDPHINIQLGSYELMEQVKKQNGQLTYVAAAYNAGPNALANWLKNRKRDDILEFIEDIPYDETRTYVKLIARNKLFYERISNRDSDLEFPEAFLFTN